MYVCMYACMYVCMYVCTYVRMYVCTYVRMYVCINGAHSSREERVANLSKLELNEKFALKGFPRKIAFNYLAANALSVELAIFNSRLGHYVCENCVSDRGPR
jgi:hypothetical protein